MHEKEIEIGQENQQSDSATNNDRKYIVLDVVFYGNSLNYDQGTGNYQELKKITKWDGKQYILVSRYALRYSILHWANKLYPKKWKLAGKDELTYEEGGVAHPNKELIDKNEILKYPEFDLFGFMIADKKKKNNGEKDKSEKEGTKAAITRVSPVKISHALSLTPYSYDSHFMANLDVMKRAGGPGSNPVTIEEKKDFYVYNIVIDMDRVGKYLKEEHGMEKVGTISVSVDDGNGRISQLIETVFNLKREIKGRMEDLSPWLVIAGFYKDGRYETYLDKIELAKSHVYKVITKEKEDKDGEGRIVKEVEHETIEKNAPKFVIDIGSNSPKPATQQQIMEAVGKFLKDGGDSQILVYKRKFIQTEPAFTESKTSDA